MEAIHIIELLVLTVFLVFVFDAIADRLYWKHNKLQNFPFEYKGKTFWYSRSVAVVPFIFAKNRFNEICILANKRGEGAADFQGLWNVPCGYLDFDETIPQAAVREVFEETGVIVSLTDENIVKINSDPTENRQNVSVHLMTMVNGHCEDITLSTDHMEHDEVAEVAWIPLSEIDKYPWAFNHKSTIQECALKLN